MNGKEIIRVCVIGFDRLCQATEQNYRRQYLTFKFASDLFLLLDRIGSFSGITAAALDPVT
jgi:hypothetical protein